MKKKRIFLFILFSAMAVCLTGSLLFRQAINSNKNYFKSSTLAANSTCTVDGKSGTYNFSFKATELTSGVDYWQCHTTSGSWTTCPNSNGCRTYKVNADSGYDQIRTYDIAGNVSSIRYLYMKDIIQISGMQDSTYVNVSGKGIGRVKIINNYYKRKGTISNVFISNEKISVTGGTEDCEKQVTYPSTKESKKICNLGTLVRTKEGYKCKAESYRLQNDTCYCAMKLVDGKLKIAWSASPGACGRYSTYCTDEFKSSDTYETKYTKVTLDHKYGAVGVICTGSNGWGSSCDFQRPESGECTAHYNNIVNVLNGDVKSYADYQEKIATGTRSYSTMLEVSKLATAGNPCDTSGDYIASYDFNSVCKSLEGKSPNIAVKTTNSYGDIYVVPVVMSAACNWVEKAPTKDNPNYGKHIQKDVGDDFYYCDDDAIGMTSDYQCIKNVTQQCYDYTVVYYYEG